MRTRRTLTFVWSVTLGLAGAACGPDQPEPGSRDQASSAMERTEPTMADAIDHEIEALSERPTRVELLAITEKREFMEKFERQISTLEQQIEAASQRLAEIDDETEDLLAARRDDLRERRIELVAKWRELEDAGAENWQDMKTAMVDAWAEAQEATDRLLDDLRDAADDDTGRNS